MQMRKLRMEREALKLVRRLEMVKADCAAERERNATLHMRLEDLHQRENNYNTKFNSWKQNIDNEIELAVAVHDDTEAECKSLRSQLFALQRERMELFKVKMDPIVIRAGPSKKTNYQLQEGFAKIIDYSYCLFQLLY